MHHLVINRAPSTIAAVRCLSGRKSRRGASATLLIAPSTIAVVGYGSGRQMPTGTPAALSSCCVAG